MAHKLINTPLLAQRKPKARLFLKKISFISSYFKRGKWGITINLGLKELFLGLLVNDIIIEPTKRRKRLHKTPGKFIHFLPNS